MGRSEVIQERSFGFLRSVMMGFFSAVLFLTFFFTIFVPYPIAITSVLHGRLRAVLVFLVAAVMTYFLVAPGSNEFQFLSLYVVFGGGSLVLAGFGLSEIVKREINPIKGLVALAGIISVINILGITLYSQFSQKTLEVTITESLEQMQPWFKQNIEEMKKTDQENVFEFEALLTQPKVMLNMIIEKGPGAYIEFLFLMLWVNLFLLLKGNRLLKKIDNVKYSEMYLMNFKMPETFIWLVIVCLLLSVSGSYFEINYLSNIGMTCLKGMGVFYFFQGFGIYLSFLNYMNVSGFIRTFLIVLTVFSAWPILVCIGLADMFVNFDKLMTKKDQGDL